MNDEAYRKKFNSLYEGIHVQSFSALCFQAIFAVHRFDLVIVNIMFTKDSPLTQFDQTESALKILCFILIQVVYLAYFHSVHPHDQPWFNRLDFCNQYALLALGNLMLGHEDSLKEVKERLRLYDVIE